VAYLQAHLDHRPLVEAQHAQRDGHLDRPAVGPARRARLPVLVPGRIELAVLRKDAVGANAREVHHEVVGGAAPVAATVDRDGDLVGHHAGESLDLALVRGEVAIATSQARHEWRAPLPAVDAEVEGVVVVEDAHARAHARGLALVREPLREGARGRSEPPRGLV
jgi:hypothetical protein